jgi:hypothetical protein
MNFIYSQHIPLYVGILPCNTIFQESKNTYFIIVSEFSKLRSRKEQIPLLLIYNFYLVKVI